jgi:hypothetical protein
MVDRYTKAVLTLIACALVYLCVIFTPLPRAHAQTPSRTPGEPSGPAEVIVVGWRAEGQATVPVAIAEVTTPQPFRVVGEVKTERSAGVADRVVLVGWEENSRREKITGMEPLSDDDQWKGFRALPVKMSRP